MFPGGGNVLQLVTPFGRRYRYAKVLTMDPVKTFVVDEKARIICPHCYERKEVPVGQFRHRGRLLKVKCICGRIFQLELEFREYRRKGTRLEGNFKSASSRWPVTVRNVSMCGGCIEMQGDHTLRVGYKGTVSFRLDDRKQSKIVQKVVIRGVNGNRLGCEFISDRHYRKELGFYLRA